MPRKPDAQPARPLDRALPLFVIVTLFVVLWAAQDVFIPVALAIFLAFILTPLAGWLERHRVPRAVAAVTVVAVVCALLVGLTYTVGNQFATFAGELDKYRSEIIAKGNRLRGSGGGFVGKLTEDVGEISRGLSEATTQSTTDATAAKATPPPGTIASTVGRAATGGPAADAPPGTVKDKPLYVSNVGGGALSGIAGWAGLILGPVGTIGLVLVLVLFMLLERDDLRDRFIRLISRGRYTVTTQALNEATTRIGKYLRAQLIVNGSYGVAVSVGLYVIGLTLGGGQTFPSFILFGVLCALLRFIPYVGPWIAAIFPIAVSLAVFPGFGVFLATTIMFVVIELISNNLMEPMLYGHTTGISTVALLVAAIVWTFLWGPYGLLMATPITVCLVVLGRHVPSLSFLDVMLGDRPALPAGARLYQRLLAGNQPEANAVVEDVLKEHGGDAAKAADEVLMPAVRLARHDRRVDELTADEEKRFYEHAWAALDAAMVAGHDVAERAARKTRDKSKDEDPDGESPDAVPAIYAPPDAPLVLGSPAHHRSEMLAVHAVGASLASAGVRLEPLSCSLLPADVEARVARDRPRAIFVAVLPPGGTTQARYLCRRLRRRFKDLPIVLGYFGTYRDYDALLVRFRAAGASYVTTSVAQARSQLTTLLGLKVPTPSPADRLDGPTADPDHLTADAHDPLCGPRDGGKSEGPAVAAAAARAANEQGIAS